MLGFIKRISILLFLIFCSISSISGEVDCDSLNPNIANLSLTHIDSLIDQCLNHRMEVEDKLEAYAHTIICYSERQGDGDRLCTGNFILGTHYYFVTNWDGALDHLYMAYNHAMNSGQDWVLAYCANFLGLTYRVMAHYDLALSYQQEYYDYGVQEDIQSIQGSTLLNLGGIYHDAGELAKGLECQLKALEIFQNEFSPNQSKEELLWLYLGLANSSQKLNAPESAIDYFNNAFEIGKELDFTRGRLWILVNAIDFYSEIDLNMAKSYLDQASILVETIDNAHIESELVYLSALIDYKSGLVEVPIAKLESIQGDVIENELKTLEFKVFELLMKIVRENNLRERELVQLRNQELRFNEQVSDFKTKSLSIWARNQKLILDHQEENISLKQAEFNKAKALHKLRIFMIFSLLAFCALGIYMFSVRELNKKTKEHNRVLQEKNNDIAAQLNIIGKQKEKLEYANNVIQEERAKLKNDLSQKMLQIANEQEMLSNLSNILEEIDIPKEGKQKINNYLSRHSRENIWEEFDQEISTSNEKFFAKLAMLSSKLTPNDFRLAALIKMNLSNKEIARLLFRTVESIHMAKSRMRKKLALDPSQMNLVAYFNYIVEEDDPENKV